VRTAGRVLLTVAILAYVLRDVDPRVALEAVGRFSMPALSAAVALTAADRLLMLWRWVLLVRTTSRAPVRELARVFFVSAFVGSFLPAGVGGDAARAYSVSQMTGQRGAAVASVVVDRWLGLLAVALSGSVGLLASIVAVPEQLRAVTLGLTLILIAGSIAGLYSDRIVKRIVPAGLQASRGAGLIVRLAGALAAFRDHPGVIGRVFVLSMVVQAVRIALAWVIGLGLGIALPFSYYWVFMPLNILVILTPLSLGGVGLPQGAMVWTLGPLGVPPTHAFLLSLLFVLAGVVGNLPGAAAYLLGPADSRERQPTRQGSAPKC
jgi:uncharacterized protein (TIRG00374 family)